MKHFKEFRMPPMTMSRDNTIVGARDTDLEEAPLVMDDPGLLKGIFDKLEDMFKKKKGKNEKDAFAFLQQLASLAGFGLSKKAQTKGKSYRYDLKK
jgi:hypothetical protein